MTQVATEARQRVYGLSPANAAHEKAGTVLGRLWLSGDITEPMRQAGERYLEIYEAAMKAINAPVGLRTRTAGDSGDVVTEEYEEWAIAAVARYRTIKNDLIADGSHSAVHMVAVEDTQPCLPIMVRLMSQGLARLVVMLGIA